MPRKTAPMASATDPGDEPAGTLSRRTTASSRLDAWLHELAERERPLAQHRPGDASVDRAGHRHLPLLGRADETEFVADDILAGEGGLLDTIGAGQIHAEVFCEWRAWPALPPRCSNGVEQFFLCFAQHRHPIPPHTLG